MSEENLTSWLGPVVELVDVLPIKEERPAVAGGRLLLTSVELWSNAVRWHLYQTVSPYADLTWPSGPSYEMSDDVGTTYQMSGGGGSSDGAGWQASAAFRPAPPAAARAIYLHGGQFRPDDRVAVELSRANSAAPPT